MIRSVIIYVMKNSLIYQRIRKIQTYTFGERLSSTHKYGVAFDEIGIYCLYRRQHDIPIRREKKN